jgi:HEAT repeat protein
VGLRLSSVGVAAALCLQPGFDGLAVRAADMQAAMKPVPDWYVRGVAAALVDPTPGVLEEAIRLPRAKDALRAISAIEPNQQRPASDALQKLASSEDVWTRLSAAEALAVLASDNLGLRKAAIDTLLELAAGPDPEVQRSAAESLGAVNPTEPDQKDAAAKAVAGLLASSDSQVQRSAIGALAALSPLSPSSRKVAVDALLNLLEHAYGDVVYSAVAALVAVAGDDAEQQNRAVDALLKVIGTAYTPDDRQTAAVGLAEITKTDPSQRRAVVDALLKLAARHDHDAKNLAAALAALNPSDPGQRAAAIQALIEPGSADSQYTQIAAAEALASLAPRGSVARNRADNELWSVATRGDLEAKESLADSLAHVVGADADQLSLSVKILLLFITSSDGHLQRSGAAALAAIPTDDPVLRTAGVDALLKLAGSQNADVQAAAAQALAAIKPDDHERSRTVGEALLKLTGSDDPEVQSAAIDALHALDLRDAERENAVATAFLKAAAGDNMLAQKSAAAALPQVAESQPELQDAVMDALLKLVGSADADVRQAAAASLLEVGPTRANEVARLLAEVGRDGAPAAPRLRAIGWAFNGAAPMANDGAVLLAFAGRSLIPSTGRTQTDPQSADRILSIFENHWPEMSASRSLQIEVAQQANAIVSLACPAPADRAGVFEKAEDRAAEEWRRTVGWLHGLFGTDDRCWRGGGRETVSRLADAFGKASLAAEHDMLDANLSADGGTPIVGKSVLTAASWAVLWTAFLVVFPYSARVRAVYLYNEKARGALSLWFLPLIMTLAPVLRRRMLRPFRDDLLADANLETLKKAEFYPDLRVRDREGTVHPIVAAIPDLRGKLLLIGESGLGKSTFLRVLADRSRRTVAYLNARSCDKGVEAAIVARVNAFESPEFFRGLVYAGDLAIVIDGLNEVSADVRAQIIAFVNGAGRANLVIATQPIEGLGGDRSPLTRATAYELMPLAREDIEKFLKSRPARSNPASAVKGEDYDRAVDKLLADALGRAPQNEAERKAEAVLQEERAAELILSNPMDLTYGSELIAMGQTPRPSQLIGQAFALACTRYRALYDRDFPAVDFARKAVALRLEDRNWLKADELANEQGVLAEFRLIIPRSINETADKQIPVMRFRHDKVMDVLMKRAFEVDKKLQIHLIDDPRFRGVYLIFAQAADRDFARCLRDRLVSHAAQTGDNGLSNEFVRLFDRQPVEPVDSAS